MKIRKVELERYKRFKKYEIGFNAEPGLPEVFLLIGDNGSGKSSILQAIAATLGTATRQISAPEALDWPGFVPATLSASYRGFAEIKVSIEFSDDELLATREFYEESDYSVGENKVPPANVPQVTLVWNADPQTNYYSVSTLPRGAGHFFQFQGRRYAYNLIYRRNTKPGLFERIGGVFWYPETRTAYSLSPFETEGQVKNGTPPVQQVDSEDEMRQMLINWFASDKSRETKVKRFNEYYGRLFPGRKLSRVVDMYGGASQTPVYFDDGVNEYDISELSGGERALMPILLDFVEWGINNSVILIDEIELHLHPPLQQALLLLLPELGKNNQFIITTHSDSVASLVSSDFIKRVVLP